MKVSKETIIRTVLLVVALINNALAIFGKSPLPIANEDITNVISLLFTIGISLWAYWKNNSWSNAAIKADEVLVRLKEGK